MMLDWPLLQSALCTQEFKHGIVTSSLDTRSGKTLHSKFSSSRSSKSLISARTHLPPFLDDDNPSKHTMIMAVTMGTDQIQLLIKNINHFCSSRLHTPLLQMCQKLAGATACDLHKLQQHIGYHPSSRSQQTELMHRQKSHSLRYVKQASCHLDTHPQECPIWWWLVEIQCTTKSPKQDFRIQITSLISNPQLTIEANWLTYYQITLNNSSQNLLGH